MAWGAAHGWDARVVPRLLPRRRSSLGAAPRCRLAAAGRAPLGGPARPRSTPGSPSASRLRCRCTARSSSTDVPHAQDHVDVLPRVLAIAGSSLGALAVVIVAAATLRRRPLGNALLVAAVAAAAAASALTQTAVAAAAAGFALAAALLYASGAALAFGRFDARTRRRPGRRTPRPPPRSRSWQTPSCAPRRGNARSRRTLAALQHPPDALQVRVIRVGVRRIVVDVDRVPVLDRKQAQLAAAHAPTTSAATRRAPSVEGHPDSALAGGDAARQAPDRDDLRNAVGRRVDPRDGAVAARHPDCAGAVCERERVPARRDASGDAAELRVDAQDAAVALADPQRATAER